MEYQGCTSGVLLKKGGIPEVHTFTGEYFWAFKVIDSRNSM